MAGQAGSGRTRATLARPASAFRAAAAATNLHPLGSALRSLLGNAPMSTLILVRHGESMWNAENRFTGW
ncbi:MAG: hypothetical protein BRC31_01755, partial [Actinobacteria bacterium QS_5_72_10]